MKRNVWRVLAGLCVLAMGVVCAAPAWAQGSMQGSQVKEKPRMYSYVGFWSIPRAQWAEMEKSEVSDQQVLQKAMSDGTIVGYGNDVNLVHQPDGPTHDDWWSAMSMAGLLNVLEQFYKSGSTTSPALESATKHWDGIYVSRYYNWHPGTYKDAYTHGSYYRLKPDAPDDAIDVLSKNVFVPLLEKQLAAGTIHEYEIDTEAIHNETPGSFWIFYLAANGDALDKVNAAVREAFQSNPLQGPAFDSMVDFKEHRDYLVRTNATYK